jgi:DNA-binding transcriptional regulator YdaS (Cro superfamily)
MNLRDYLKANRITQAEFAKKLVPPVSQGKVNHWLHGVRRVSLVEAIQIERITAGEVSMLDLAQVKAPTNAVYQATKNVAKPEIYRTGTIRRHDSRREHDAIDPEGGRRETFGTVSGDSAKQIDAANQGA